MTRNHGLEKRGALRTALIVAMCGVPVTAIAQAPGPADLNSKIRYHAESAFGPWAIVGSAAYAGILQGVGSPQEWEQGAGAYGRRVGSTVGASAIHSVLAFGLDSTLRQDPRYFRSGSGGFWHRTGHALRGTMLTRTDRGGETLSTWRLGSAYGAAFLSNQWYPDRLNTVRYGILQGSLQVGFDFASNVGSEFWPDIRRKIFLPKR